MDTAVSIVRGPHTIATVQLTLLASLTCKLCAQAYPVMGLIVFACVMPCVVGWKMWSNPDNRFFKADRKRVLRGNPADLDAMFESKAN